VYVKKDWAHEEYVLPDYYLSEHAALCEAETEKIRIWTEVDEDLGQMVEILLEDE
jgi:hypothetical protein